MKTGTLITVLILIASAAQGQLVFTVNMDGAQADAGAGTGSLFTGSGTVTLNATEDQIAVALTHDIPNGDVTAGHIHVGPPGVSGGIVFPFATGQSPINEVFAISPLEVITLKSEGYYVNIHTNAFINGEIRGQILNLNLPAASTPNIALAVLAIMVVMAGTAWGLRSPQIR